MKRFYHLLISSPACLLRFSVLFFLFSPMLLFPQQPFKVDSLNLQLKSSSSDSSRIKILWELSDLYRNTEFRRSLEYADSALELSNKHLSSLHQAVSYNKMGSLLFEIGLYNRSLDNNLKSKRLYENLSNQSGLISVNHNIGAIYFQLADYDQALEYFHEALRVGNQQVEMGDSSFYSKIPVLYNSIANIYDQMGDNEKALSYYLEARGVALKFDDNKNLGVIYNNLGKLSQEMGKQEDALKYLNLSFECRKKENNKSGLARSHNFLAIYHANLGNFAEARKAAERGLKIAEEIGSLFSQRTSSLLLYRAHRGLGNITDALDILIHYNKISDSLFNDASMRDVTRLQMEYDFNTREEKRIERQKQTSLINIFLFAILILALVIFGLLYGFVRERARRISMEKIKLVNDLEYRNKELATNVLYLLKNTKVMGEAAGTLKSLQTRMDGENKASLQQVIHDLRSASEKDIWEEFEIRFQEVHKEFFPNLKAKFPELTPGELKICSFLRLNMTTKEISSMTHQNAKSIEVTRSRIRKKLKLTNTDINLISFLMEF